MAYRSGREDLTGVGPAPVLPNLQMCIRDRDKAYLESVYKAGAEKASYVANKTLRKVYKKVGFVAR